MARPGSRRPRSVFLSDDLRVAGVIDFGALTVIGDPGLDLASALAFLEEAPGYQPVDSDFVLERLVSRVGSDFVPRYGLYRAWYAIRFAPYRDDPDLYERCLGALRAVTRPT